MNENGAAVSMDEIKALCKRRGFIYPASEIYGGLNGFWDYGPLGAVLKNNLRDDWWRNMVLCPPLGPDGEPEGWVKIAAAADGVPRLPPAGSVAAGMTVFMLLVADRVTDDPIEAGYFGVYLWAQAVEDAETAEVAAVRSKLGRQSFAAPEGIV